MDRIHGAYETAVQSAESGTEALRGVWPREIPHLDAGQEGALKDALRCLEDGWAALLRARPSFADE
jgi:hypothetical protein